MRTHLPYISSGGRASSQQPSDGFMDHLIWRPSLVRSGDRSKLCPGSAHFLHMVDYRMPGYAQPLGNLRLPQPLVYQRFDLWPQLF